MKIYIVGGAVRDAAMGLKAKDEDYVVVGATPEEMLAKGFKQVGADFPVFLHPQSGDEWALARTERKSGSGYLGFDVETDGVTLEEDLSRRDLTMNAMAIAIGSDEIIDPFGGLDDIKNRVLRHVGPAFAEDPLRVIRLARFFARYEDFTVAGETAKLCEEVVDSGELDALPFERFWAELEKVFTEKRPDRFFQALHEMGALKKVRFFQRVFGDTPIQTLMWIAEKLKLPQEQRVRQFVALVGTQKALKDVAASTEIMDVHRNLRFARSIKKVVNRESVHAFIKQAGGFQRGEHGLTQQSMDALDAISLSHQLGLDDFSSLAEGWFMMAWMNATRVGQADFPELSGKELGEAIKNKRMDMIMSSINMST